MLRKKQSSLIKMFKPTVINKSSGPTKKHKPTEEEK